MTQQSTMGVKGGVINKQGTLISIGGGNSIIRQANPNNPSPNGMEVGGGTTSTSNPRNQIQ